MPVSMQTFGLTPGRINKYKGEILAHAVPVEILGREGRQVKMPKNMSDTDKHQNAFTIGWVYAFSTKAP